MQDRLRPGLRPAQRLLAGAVLAAVAAGCGGDADDVGTKEPSPVASSAESTPTESLLLLTQVDLPKGTVLAGSKVGDSAFCPGGTFADTHGTDAVGLVDRLLTCADGTLRIGFDPREPVGNTQAGPWRIVSGTGVYAGWQGRGDMTMTYDGPAGSPQSEQGKETFTGSVTR